MNATKRKRSILLLAAALVAVVVLTVCIATCGGGEDDASRSEPTSLSAETLSSADEASSADALPQADEPRWLTLDQPVEFYSSYLDGITCTLKSITAVADMGALDITLGDLSADADVAFDVGLESQTNLVNPAAPNPHNRERQLFVDEAGRLVENCYMLVIDLEVHNISARNGSNSWSEENVFTLSALPYVIVRREDGGFDLSAEIVYFRETGLCSVDQYPCFELNIGETKTFRVGYLVYDASERPLENVGFSETWEYPFNQNDVFRWVDLSGAISG